MCESTREEAVSQMEETLTLYARGVFKLCYWAHSHSKSTSRPALSPEQTLVLTHLCTLLSTPMHTMKKRWEKVVCTRVSFVYATYLCVCVCVCLNKYCFKEWLAK